MGMSVIPIYWIWANISFADNDFAYSSKTYPTVHIHAQIRRNRKARPIDVFLNRRTNRHKAVSMTAVSTKAHTPEMVITEAPLFMQYTRDALVAQLQRAERYCTSFLIQANRVHCDRVKLFSKFQREVRLRTITVRKLRHPD
jgi:hypothetical protein